MEDSEGTGNIPFSYVTEILPLSPVEIQIDGSPEVGDIEMEANWGYIDHFREINLPSIETALQMQWN